MSLICAALQYQLIRMRRREGSSFVGTVSEQNILQSLELAV